MKIPVISKVCPLKKDYKPCLTRIDGGYMLEKRAARCLERMLWEAKEYGIKLRVFSAYRTPEYQRKLFEDDIRRYMEQGLTYEMAYMKTSESVALPYESEHNSGLAIDITSEEWGDDEITEEFAKTEESRWLLRNAANFGFILRYPKDKMQITGITYEPWHYRYVGLPHSKIIMEKGITLEEYLKLCGVKNEFF